MPGSLKAVTLLALVAVANVAAVSVRGAAHEPICQGMCKNIGASDNDCSNYCRSASGAAAGGGGTETFCEEMCATVKASDPECQSKCR